VVALSSGAVGGYASIYIAERARVVSTSGYDIDPALAVAVVPNAILAHIALTRVARMAPGESILIHGGLGAFAAAFPGIAKQLGASRIVGTVRPGRAIGTRLPYDALVESGSDFSGKFDVIIDPVGGEERTRSLDLLAPFGRLLLVGNAGGDWEHSIGSNRIWFDNATVAGFNAGAYVPAHPGAVRPAAEAEAALTAVAAGLADVEIETRPLADPATAHERLESHTATGRLVLTT
jgi:NADPH:quinone reductase